jgi:hypothetical protein
MDSLIVLSKQLVELREGIGARARPAASTSAAHVCIVGIHIFEPGSEFFFVVRYLNVSPSSSQYLIPASALGRSIIADEVA